MLGVYLLDEDALPKGDLGLGHGLLKLVVLLEQYDSRKDDDLQERDDLMRDGVWEHDWQNDLAEGGLVQGHGLVERGVLVQQRRSVR